MKVTKNGFAGQSLGDQPALLLLRGKSGRSESPAADVAEAVNALMQAVHFPAAASINTQVSLVFQIHNVFHGLRAQTLGLIALEACTVKREGLSSK